MTVVVVYLFYDLMTEVTLNSVSKCNRFNGAITLIN